MVQLSTGAKPTKCSRCKQSTWTLFVEGIQTTLGVEPVDLAAELQLRLAGVRAYQTRPDGSTFQARVRNRYTIPNANPAHVVLPEHVCRTDTLISNGHPNYYANRYGYTFTEEPQF